MDRIEKNFTSPHLGCLFRFELKLNGLNVTLSFGSHRPPGVGCYYGVDGDDVVGYYFH